MNAKTRSRQPAVTDENKNGRRRRDPTATRRQETKKMKKTEWPGQDIATNEPDQRIRLGFAAPNHSARNSGTLAQPPPSATNNFVPNQRTEKVPANTQ
jgi:hypothetical protein